MVFIDVLIDNVFVGVIGLQMIAPFQISHNFPRESPYISNTFSRESLNFHASLRVSKRNPRHSKDLTRKLLDLEIQTFFCLIRERERERERERKRDKERERERKREKEGQIEVARERVLAHARERERRIFPERYIDNLISERPTLTNFVGHILYVYNKMHMLM